MDLRPREFRRVEPSAHSENVGAKAGVGYRRALPDALAANGPFLGPFLGPNLERDH